MVKIAAIFILVFLLLGGIYLGYKSINKQPAVVPQKTNTIVSPTASPTPAPTEVDRPISLRERPTAGDTDNTQTVAAIKRTFKSSEPLSFNIGAYFDSRGIMISPYGIGGTVEKSTPKEAGQKLDKFFEKATGPWNFENDNPTAQKLINADPASFKGTIIGTSPDRYGVAFTLNDEFMIDKILMLSDWKVILP